MAFLQCAHADAFSSESCYWRISCIQGNSTTAVHYAHADVFWGNPFYRRTYCTHRKVLAVVRLTLANGQWDRTLSSMFSYRHCTGTNLLRSLHEHVFEGYTEKQDISHPIKFLLNLYQQPLIFLEHAARKRDTPRAYTIVLNRQGFKFVNLIQFRKHIYRVIGPSSLSLYEKDRYI